MQLRRCFFFSVYEIARYCKTDTFVLLKSQAHSYSLLERSICSFLNFLSGDLDLMLFCSRKFKIASLSISYLSNANILFLNRPIRRSGSLPCICLSLVDSSQTTFSSFSNFLLTACRIALNIAFSS